jgi:DNA invertase Pin-like site-specific DNA recombinase
MDGFREMLVGYVRISTSDDRQSTDLQRDALRSAGVDERNIHEDKASGARDDRPGLKLCPEFLRPSDVLMRKRTRIAILTAAGASGHFARSRERIHP